MRTIRTSEKRKLLLESIVEFGGNVSRALEKARVGRSAAYEWKRDDEEFSELWEKALEDGIDRLEDEARRRACEGVKKPVYQGGKRVGFIQEYSDTLLMFLLNGARPEKYRHNASVNVTGKLSHDVVERVDIGSLTDDEIAEIRAGKVAEKLFTRLANATPETSDQGGGGS